MHLPFYINSARILALLLMAAATAACGGGGGAPANAGPADMPPGDDRGSPGVVIETLDLAKLSFCHDDGTGIRVVTDEFGAELGYLCVIRPSDIESGQLDADPDFSGNGFGYHVVAFPKNITDQTKAAILISGAYGAPYNPTHLVHLDIPAGSIRYEQTLIDGINSDFIVIQPAYNNPSSVNLDKCGPDADFIQSSNPNCHDLARTWVLTGEQYCLVNQATCQTIETFTLGSEEADRTNSFFHRLETLVDHLQPRIDSLPVELVTLDYPNLHVAGHSQGSGHAYLIARHLHEVARVCYLAGPRDYDRINDEYADWFTPTDASTLTPIGRMRGLVSDRDAERAIVLSWIHLGLGDSEHFQVVSDPRGVEGHQAVFDSPDHSQIRQEFCF